MAFRICHKSTCFVDKNKNGVETERKRLGYASCLKRELDILAEMLFKIPARDVLCSRRRIGKVSDGVEFVLMVRGAAQGFRRERSGALPSLGC